MKIRLVKDEQVFFGTDYANGIYEGKKGDKCYLTIDGRVSEDPPEYFTKSFYMDEFDFVIIEKCDINCCCNKEQENEES